MVFGFLGSLKNCVNCFFSKSNLFKPFLVPTQRFPNLSSPNWKIKSLLKIFRKNGLSGVCDAVRFKVRLFCLRLVNPGMVFNHQDYSYLDLPSGIQYGFNAEQVQSVMPSIVYEKTGKRIAGKNLYKNYSKKQVDETTLIPFLVASINELQNEISLLREELAQMKNK